MSAQAQLEGIVEPTEVAATPDVRARPERRVFREPAEAGLGLDRWIAAGILGGAAVIYGLLGVLVYSALVL